MSKMGNVILDITERFEAGQDVQRIAKDTKTTKSFVEGVILEHGTDSPDQEFVPAIVGEDGIPF